MNKDYNEVKSSLIVIIRVIERMFKVPDCESILRTKAERRAARAKRSTPYIDLQYAKMIE